MAVTYCTGTQVADFLQLPAFTSGTEPKLAQVEDRINEAEDWIDRETLHAWRLTTVTNEYHDFPKVGSYDYNTYDGVPVHLQHRNIFLTASPDFKLLVGTDKLEVFDGEDWIDWTATMTDSRSGDFWVEPNTGILYLRVFTTHLRIRAIRITYRYGVGPAGSAVVPKDIQRAAILHTAIWFVQNEDRTVNLPDDGGSSQIKYADKTAGWKRELLGILSNRTEFVTF